MKPFDGDLTLGLDVDDLMMGMDARVGAARHVRAELTEHLGEGILQITLDGPQSGLGRVARETAPVVGEVEPVVHLGCGL